MKQTLKVFGFTLPVFSSKVTFGLVAPTARKGTLAASLTLEAAMALELANNPITTGALS